MNGDEPAFARSAWLGPNGELEAVAQVGLTKRELFAAMAMQGMLGDPKRSGSTGLFAAVAVAQADALLAELAKESV